MSQAQQPQQYSTQPAQNGNGQQYNQSQQSTLGGGPPKNLSNDDLLMYIVCFFCPPLAVFWLKGGCETEVIITTILWFCFWFPGFIYALFQIFQKQKQVEQEKSQQSGMV